MLNDCFISNIRMVSWQTITAASTIQLCRLEMMSGEAQLHLSGAHCADEIFLTISIKNTFQRFEHRRHTSVAMNRNYSETSMISIAADKNNKAIILDVGGKKHKIRGLLKQYCFIGFLKLLLNFSWQFQYLSQYSAGETSEGQEVGWNSWLVWRLLPRRTSRIFFWQARNIFILMGVVK